MKELNFKHTWKQICYNRIQLSRNGKEVVGSAIKVFDVFLHRPGSILISREENLLKIKTVECVIGIVRKAVIVILANLATVVLFSQRRSSKYKSGSCKGVVETFREAVEQYVCPHPLAQLAWGQNTCEAVMQ